MITGTAAAQAASDGFLAGYVTSILEQKLLWKRDSFRVDVRNGVATVTLIGENPARSEAAEQALSNVDGLQGVQITAIPTAPAAQAQLRAGRILFPVGDPFRPLLADPKQPQFFFSFLRLKSPTTQAHVAAVGYGESFGLMRWLGEHPGDGLQLSVNGGLFAQFNLSTPSADLVNADYTVGIALSGRRGPLSAKINLSHMSSHLGDEFLLDEPDVSRVNLSLEAIDLMLSYEWETWRLYGGGGYLLHRNPDDLKRGLAQTGIEYRRSQRLWNIGRPVGGLDIRSIEERDWDTGISFKAGLEFGQPEPGRRSVRLLAEAYKGFAPFGQFYNAQIEYYGLGFYLGF